MPMTAEQLAIYQKHTGRTTPPTTPFGEAWLICGRRSGKSFMLAMIAIFLAVFKDWRPYLGPGELGTIMVVCADRKQARTIMRFAIGLLKETPMLRRQIVGVTRDSITLKNNIIIEVHTASHKSTRGYTIVCSLNDEIAKWQTDAESAEQDAEILAAIRPAMSTVPSSIMLCASSPYARKGVLWEAYDKHYGKNNDRVLVWKATTREMNPTVEQSFIDEQLEADPARNAAEYLAQFRSDLEFVFQLERVRACITPGVYERPYVPGTAYLAFADPSAGVANSFTLCIAHQNYIKQTVVIDCLREIRAPFSPEAAVAELMEVLKQYHLTTVFGDNHGSNWAKEQWARFGGSFVSEKIKSASKLYGDALSAVNSTRVEMLEDQRCVSQLCSLERRTVRGGDATISHPTGPNFHDDVANAFAGAVSLLIGRGVFNWAAMGNGPTNNDQSEADRNAAFQARRYMDHILSFDPNTNNGPKYSPLPLKYGPSYRWR